MGIQFFFKSDDRINELFDCQCLDFGGPFADCHECKGSGKWSFSRPLNGVDWSEVNAHDLSQKLGFDLDSGIIEQSQFPRLLARCVRLLNTQSLGDLVEEPFDTGAAPRLRLVDAPEKGQARTVFFGRDLESLRRRVKDFQALIVAAKAAGDDIYFG